MTRPEVNTIIKGLIVQYIENAGFSNAVDIRNEIEYWDKIRTNLPKKKATRRKVKK